MGWRDLLQSENETVTLPWTGGRSLHLAQQYWKLEGPMPPEYGWYRFSVRNRTSRLVEPIETVESDVELLRFDRTVGFLIGDRIIPDSARVEPDHTKLAASCSYPVALVEPGLDRFARIEVGKICESGGWIYRSLAMPLGMEDQVQSALFDEKDSIDDIPNVPPALDVAFRLERWRRQEAERRRLELERIRREEEDRRVQEAARQARLEQVRESIGDGQLRRELAKTDFESAARAALRVSGAQYLDHRAHVRRNEYVVQFRFQNRRFECVCDGTLKIIDSGICLTDERTGEKGDTRFTLESLPGVIAEAIRSHRLVVFRHVD